MGPRDMPLSVSARLCFRDGGSGSMDPRQHCWSRLVETKCESLRRGVGKVYGDPEIHGPLGLVQKLTCLGSTFLCFCMGVSDTSFEQFPGCPSETLTCIWVWEELAWAQIAAGRALSCPVCTGGSLKDRRVSCRKLVFPNRA